MWRQEDALFSNININIMKRSLLLTFLAVFLLGSCSLLKKPVASTNEFDTYQEDLGETIITFPDLETQLAKEEVAETTPTGALAVDQDLEVVLNRLRQNNEAEMFWSGYTVLVFSGVDRDLAFKTRNDLFTFFPSMKTDMQYQQPRYLIKVGKFANRIEALSYYHQLKPQFPAARIIQDRFIREGYVAPEPKPIDGDR